MKKLVTSLFLIALLAVTSESFAQQAVMNSGSVLTQDNLPAHLRDRHIPGAQVPLATETSIIYVDLEGENLKYYFLPTTLSYNAAGDRDTIVSLAQRFTTPFTRNNTYLSSVSMILGPLQIVNPDDSINLAIWRVQVQNDIRYVGTKVAGSDRSIKMSDLILEEPNTVTVDFGNKKVAFAPGSTDFFVTVSYPYYSDLPFEEQTFIGVFGDSNEYGGAYDPELHRMVVQGFQFQFSYSGITNSEGPWYANLAMEAVVNDGVADVADVNATSFSLKQNFPNPFNPSTEINYSVKETMPVSIKVFNTMGVEIAALVNEVKAMGSYTVNFDASNLPSGSYMYTMTAGGETITKAMTLSK